MKTIDKIITKCNCQYGAPMGRYNVDNREIEEINGTKYAKFNGKLFDCKIPLNYGGYDKGGAYWGIGSELRVSYTKDLTYINFYRK